MWSYCSQIQRLLARSGQASSRVSAASGSFSGGSVRASKIGGRRRRPARPVVLRRRRDQRRDRHVDHHLAVLANDHVPGVGDLADDGEVQLPLFEDGARLGLGARPQHHQHPLLALRQHDLVGGHAGLAGRHPVQVQLDADAALRRHLERRGGKAGGAHVLDGDDRVGRHQLQARLDQQLLGERIADLHRRPLRLRLFAELGGRHGRAVNAVPPGLRADVDQRIARPGGGGIEDALGPRQTHRHRVDQDVAVVTAMERALSRHRRHADAVAVAGDAADHAGHQVPRLRVRGIAEAQRIQVGDRPRAHREHVAEDAADAGRRPLVRLDVGRVVVALHLEDHRLPIADIDNAGVLARPADHPGRLRRQPLEPALRGLVRAVLAPHHREHAEFGQARRAPQHLQDARVLLGGEPVLGDDFGRDLGHYCLRETSVRHGGPFLADKGVKANGWRLRTPEGLTHTA